MNSVTAAEHLLSRPLFKSTRNNSCGWYSRNCPMTPKRTWPRPVHLILTSGKSQWKEYELVTRKNLRKRRKRLWGGHRPVRHCSSLTEQQNSPPSKSQSPPKNPNPPNAQDLRTNHPPLLAHKKKKNVPRKSSAHSIKNRFQSLPGVVLTKFSRAFRCVSLSNSRTASRRLIGSRPSKSWRGLKWRSLRARLLRSPNLWLEGLSHRS